MSDTYDTAIIPLKPEITKDVRKTADRVLSPCLAAAMLCVPDDPGRRFERVSAGQHYPAEDVIMPVRATRGSAGYDFVLPADITIPAGKIVKIATDVKARMRPHDTLLLTVRSSLPIKRKLVMPHGVAVIDADYYGNPENDGNIMGVLWNIGSEDVILRKGERFMQGLFVEYMVTDDDAVTARRQGGMGSTDDPAIS